MRQKLEPRLLVGFDSALIQVPQELALVPGFVPPHRAGNGASPQPRCAYQPRPQTTNPTVGSHAGSQTPARVQEERPPEMARLVSQDLTTLPVSVTLLDMEIKRQVTETFPKQEWAEARRLQLGTINPWGAPRWAFTVEKVEYGWGIFLLENWDD